MSARLSLKQKLRSLLYLGIGGSTAFAALCIYKHNEDFYNDVLMPAVHLLSPETAHRTAVLVAKYRLLPRSDYADPEELKVKLLGRQFSNPVGVAAGFDKHGEAVLGLEDMGFGFVEIGSVTPRPQPGNERPRVFRLKEDQAVINRYGFNSEGHDAVYNRLEKLRKEGLFKGVLGINLGKNKESQDSAEDYAAGIRKFNNLADYLVINISSPNTPGLRNLQNKSDLELLLKKVVATRNEQSKKTPLLLKLAPDLSADERRDIAAVISKRECRVDGLIISNTTVERPLCLQSECKNETGGLSGLPLRDSSTEMIGEMYRLTKGMMPIIGVGGISSGKDAYDKIKAGASVVQIYTSMVYGGPLIVGKIKRELVELLQKDKRTAVADAVGKGV